MARYRYGSLIKASLLGLLTCLWLMLSQSSIYGQLGDVFLEGVWPSTAQLTVEGEDAVSASCVRLDGYCVFRVAAPKSDLSARIREVEAVLRQVKAIYVDDRDAELDIDIRYEESPELTPERMATEAENDIEEETPAALPRTPSIYVSVTGREATQPLMSVTRFDAALKGVDEETAAESYQKQITDGLARSRSERRSPYLLTQTGICIGVVIFLLGIGWALVKREQQLRLIRAQLRESFLERSRSLQSFLDERQRWNVTEVQLRVAQLVRAGLLIGGILFVMSRFPYTRAVEVRIVDSLYIPFRLLLTALGIYLAIRLSFALINRLTGVLANSYEITPELNRRMQLRVNTISRVSRGIVILIWLGVGLLSALTAVGLNIGPLLAGAGIIGVALSLPAQSLIKDAINGFFIILEDQYAVGDVITVHGIRGLVENINLRITQIRDEEGRLVTIPNSEIQLIANHSSNWSQADVYIPISYHTDVDAVLDLITKIGLEMKDSDRWHDAMLVEPEVLGVEEFGERGLVIRVWIKTQPLKQWDVAREYRRRLKVALDAAGIVIPAHIDFKAPAPA
ncbi:MAG: mechanosensitive ion channel family protein [Cyanobacteria bacterium P01_H01_bin.58]